MSNNAKSDTQIELPVIPLRDTAVFPGIVIPLFIGRKKSILALEESLEHSNKMVFLGAQKDGAVENPRVSSLYKVGCIASVLQMLKLPDSTIKVLVEARHRARIVSSGSNRKYMSAKIEVLPYADNLQKDDNDALVQAMISEFGQYVKLNKRISPEVQATLAEITNAVRLADTIAAHMPLKLDEKQEILATLDVNQRVDLLIGFIRSAVEVNHIEQRVKNRVRSQMEKKQREWFLNEQIEAIKKELSESDDSTNEYEVLKRRIAQAKMPEEVKTKAESELNKLKLMPPMSAEATVSRHYLEVLLDVPWKKSSPINDDLISAEQILEAEHYGLKDVKERILEYLAVQNRVKKPKGTILCLVGPPGVGKTSLGQSIAQATGRKFCRVSLGGVRDEAEIRGHRRTYIGALPGKIIQKLNKTGVNNPLFLLDEIDKMTSDFRGDPGSALLEVLDPEQNSTFNDHYLEVDFDLSNVMFICTANTLDIPLPLLDRLEVIHLSGYTEEEKLNIAKKYLIPKQLELNGLKSNEAQLPDSVLLNIIQHYTRESGVRNLDREISKIFRKIVKELAKKTKTKQVKVSDNQLVDFLGVQKYRYTLSEKNNRVGLVTGLAWTQVGGDLLTLEAIAVVGKGKSTCTGSLGDVMQESIQAALTVIRSRADYLGLEKDFYGKHDIHVHVPEGATPKDGPSAGIGMCTALVSALTGIPVKASVGMTGEITLRGEVLPIGGLKEKLLAAHRGGLKMVIIPMDNVKDLKDIPDNVKNLLDIRPVKWIDEVLQLSLEKMPKPLSLSEDQPSSSEKLDKLIVPTKKSRISKPSSRETH